MNTMNYQAYAARIDYDERDHVLVGRLLGVRAIISFHAQTVGELRKEFEFAVDDYLAECAEKNVRPETPATPPPRAPLKNTPTHTPYGV
jgi:predicted HicB family RNase H-like nuclease